MAPIQFPIMTEPAAWKPTKGENRMISTFKVITYTLVAFMEMKAASIVVKLNAQDSIQNMPVDGMPFLKYYNKPLLSKQSAFSSGLKGLNHALDFCIELMHRFA